MNGYFVGLFALCVCICIVELLSPAGEGEGIARHIKLLCALCLLSTMLSPLNSLLNASEDLPDWIEEWFSQWLETEEEQKDEYEKLWEQECEKIDTAYAEAAVATLIVQRLSLSERDVRVSITLNSQGSSIDSVRVALSGKAIWVNTHEIEDYVLATLGCECIIYIE